MKKKSFIVQILNRITGLLRQSSLRSVWLSITSNRVIANTVKQARKLQRFIPRKRIIASISLGVILIIGGLLYTYSSSLSSLIVSRVSAHLEENVASSLHIPHIKISYDQISWAGFKHPLTVSIKGVSIHNGQGSLMAKEAKVSLNFWRVLLGKFRLRSLKIYDATFSFKDNQLLSGSTKIYFKGDYIRIKGNVKVNSLEQLTQLSFIPSWVKGMHLPAMGKYFIEFSPTGGLKVANLNINATSGVVDLPEVFPQPVTVDALILEASSEGQDLTLTRLQMDHAKTQCSASATLHASVNWAHLWQQGGTITMTSKAKAQDLAFDELKNLWPIPLTPKPRKWVTENLSVGVAKTIKLSLAGSAEIGQGGSSFSIKLPTVEGAIDAENVTVKYLGDLPPVVGVSGGSTFTKQQFDIWSTTGIVNEVALEKGRVLITNLDQEDHDISIDLQLKGALRKKLEVLSAKPLAFPQKLGLDSANVSGDSVTNVSLAFPLEQNLPLSSVTVHSKTSITNGSIKTSIPAGDDKVKLSNGIFDLEADTHHLLLTGKAEINGLPAGVTWRENFDDQAPYRRQFVVKGDTKAEKLSKVIGFALDPYLQEDITVDLVYTGEINKGAGTLEATLDLQEARMMFPLFRWEKTPKKPGTMTLKMKTTKDGENRLQNLQISAPNLTFTAQGTFRPDQSMQCKVDRFHIGQNKLTAQLTTSGKTRHLNIRAQTLDLKDVFKDVGTQEWPIAAHPWQITIKADVVNLEKQSLIDLNGTLTYRQDQIQKAKLTGKFYPSRHPIEFNIEPPVHKDQHFEIKSKDGGELLNTFGVTDAIQGGELTLKGIKTRTGKAWQIGGQLSLASFSIRNAPLLTRLLAAASPTGMINLLAGKNLQMSSGEAHFLLTPQHLIIENAKASSAALAMVIHGHLDRIKNVMDFAGEVIPLYALNTALAHIPVIGTLLSGNESEGIFVTTFTLKGPRENPELSINPLSTFTPGIIRKAFGG